MDESGPVEVVAKSGKSGCRLVYANGIYVEHRGGFGIHFHGSNGEVLVNRGKFVLVVDDHNAGFKWDPAKCEFAGGTGDPKWLTRDYRSPWTV